MPHYFSAYQVKQPAPDSKEARSRDSFVFSDDINDWILSKQKKNNDENKVKRKYNRKPKNDERLN
jgi:hypothetical protein